MKTRIGVDTGGTFTDFVLFDASGLRVHKVRSTPDEPSRAILTGIAELLTESADEVIHGSTVATNALLERKGARVAFLTTAGFEHVLHIGRQTRPELYRLVGTPRRHLIDDDLVFGVRERTGAYGEVVEALSQEEIQRIVEAISRVEPDAVAICLLHSYAYPEHEQRLSQELRGAGFAVSASHEILPEYREFERASTTAVNAYVTPVMAGYLTTLERSLESDALRISQSAGGFISVDEARREAVRTVLSGPAGGAAGALAVAEASGFPRVIAFDMGGTSTDVSLLDGALPMSNESVVGDFPIRLPSLDIHTVGAGGGSIAFVDSGGALRVGPRSAGADPGPACYGTGDELTVTDANLLLGRLDPEFFLGGRMKLDVERPQRLAEQLAARLNLNVPELAEGIVRIANSNIERALRVVSVQRGHDPRDFALLAFGGAGGMHGCDVAAALEIKTVLVPEHAGILSALGMLLSDQTKQYSKALLRQADLMCRQELESVFDPIEKTARAELHEAGFDEASIHVERSLDLRYLGQSYEITVPFTVEYRAAFDRIHEKLYGYHDRERIVEIVNVRVKAIGVTEKPALPRYPLIQAQTAVPGKTSRCIFDGVVRPTPLFARASMSPGFYGTGPAIIAGSQATTVVPPGWQFKLDEIGTLVLTHAVDAAQGGTA
ncbi:MAG: hydantoinase/oxoprolinase family protein [Acidobacteriaceae bacterium]|nr:hydantoinase/oxoprolinase family protein [Acidobacteriaceae bacterium]